MIEKLGPGLWACSLSFLFLLSGCAMKPVNMQQVENLESAAQEASPAPAAVQSRQPAQNAPVSRIDDKKNTAVTRRAVTEKELRTLQAKDTELDFYRCIEILSRLNKKDKEYIRQDMKHKRAISVPKDFASYKDWSPLPRTISGVGKFPKLILVVKDIPFLGCYERGNLVDDTYIGIGKMRAWTKRGMYRVKQKDPDHMSTYPNAYGDPAYMPCALHVYDRVWIHAGDVIGPNCSHGCINVPLYHAEKLYSWTDIGTVVVITESLKDLGREIKVGFQEKTPQNGPVKGEQKGNSTPKTNI